MAMSVMLHEEKFPDQSKSKQHGKGKVNAFGEEVSFPALPVASRFSGAGPIREIPAGTLAGKPWGDQLLRAPTSRTVAGRES